MRILFVITELCEGGAENALRHIAWRLHDQGHKIKVICLYGDNGDIAIFLKEKNIPVECLEVVSLWDLPNLLKLKKITAEFQPDIIHSWLFHANFFIRFFIPESIPLICSLRVVEPRKTHILFDRWTRKRVEKYLCVSGNVSNFAQKILHISKDKCEVINNGVDYEFFATSRTQNREFTKINGLTIGRLTHQKGIDILLKSLSHLPDNLYWTWKIIGNAPEPKYADYLRQLAIDLNIAKNIEWYDFVERKKIVAYFENSNLFILPSRWEGQANVIFEAMAAGIPVMASSRHGLDEVLNENSNCLQIIVENKPEVWSKAIIDFWSNKSQMQSHISNGIDLTQSLTWEKVTLKHIAVYNSAINSL